MRKLTDKERENIVKLIGVLKKHKGGLWIRELSRQSKLHMETVRRLIQRYPEVFEQYADFTSYRINLKLIRLKNPNITENNLDLALEL